MKKFLSFLLAAVLLLPALTSCATELHEHNFVMTQDVAPTCEEDGYKAYLCECGEQKIEKFPAIGHDFEELQSTQATCEDFGIVKKVCKNCNLDVTTTEEPLGHEWDGDPDDYVSLHTCARCGTREAFSPEDPFSEHFESGYTEELKAAAPALIEQIRTFLADGTGDGADLAKLFDDLQTQLDLLAKATDRLEIMTYLDESVSEQYSEANELLQAMNTERRELFVLAYNSAYREAVFADWEETELADFIADCERRSDPAYAALVARSDAISNEVIQHKQSDPAVAELLKELVGINNQIAVYNGYKNYYEYAYAEIYGRAYNADKIDLLIEYTDKYIIPYYNTLIAKSEELQKDPRYEQMKGIADSLEHVDLFANEKSHDVMAAFLKTMRTENTDMFAEINKLFADGRLLFGDTPAAFTADDYMDDPLIYLAQTDYYSALFTVVHEFGHYVYFVKEPTILLDYDLAETHSQGNEMMLLAFLHDYLLGEATTEEERDDYEYLYELIATENLMRFLSKAIQFESIDYFEYMLYSGKIKNNDYAAYIKENLPNAPSANYTIFVSAYTPCYYISYAVSALPAVKLYNMACEDYENAMEAYFKLFNYTDDLGKETDHDGTTYTNATYEDILNYAGIGSLFEESFYDLFRESSDN